MSELGSQASPSGTLRRVVVQHSIAPVAEAVCTLLQQFRPSWKVEVGEVHQTATLRNVDALWVEGAYASQLALQAPMVWLAEDTSYSVLGIRQGILDYLLVPVDPSEVEASVARVEDFGACARVTRRSCAFLAATVWHGARWSFLKRVATTPGRTCGVTAIRCWLAEI